MNKAELKARRKLEKKARKESARQRAGAGRRGPPPPPEPERRPLYTTAEEADYLGQLLEGRGGPGGRLAAKVAEVRRAFRDSAEKLREEVAKAQANGFWEEDKGQRPLERYLKTKKKALKERERRAVEEIAHLPPDQLKQILEAEAAARKNGAGPARAGEGAGENL